MVSPRHAEGRGVDLDGHVNSIANKEAAEPGFCFIQSFQAITHPSA
jgi:hypothetical protein